MSKLYYEALSKIPKKFIDEQTYSCDWKTEHAIIILIANPKYEPMVYVASIGKWRKLRLAGITPSYIHNLELRRPDGLDKGSKRKT
jgi:hypothetical protein